MMDNYDHLSTPELVRLYRDLHVQGSQERLNNEKALALSYVVNELRLRRVLD